MSRLGSGLVLWVLLAKVDWRPTDRMFFVNWGTSNWGIITLTGWSRLSLENLDDLPLSGIPSVKDMHMFRKNSHRKWSLFLKYEMIVSNHLKCLLGFLKFLAVSQDQITMQTKCSPCNDSLFCTRRWGSEPSTFDLGHCPPGVFLSPRSLQTWI